MKDRKKTLSLISCLKNIQRQLLTALFLVITLSAFAQSKTLTGTVIDASTQPIIGASILVSGTTNGTITDLNGKFELKDVPSKGKIKVSYIGYKTQEVSVLGKTVLKIILAEDTETLDEVIVVGYGTQKKSDITGAMSRMTTKELEDRPVQNALQAMQGKVTGVDVTSNNRPGELGDIRIRGNRSINASNTPLYVVDGIPLTAGSMTDLDPNNIESMEILKDASATAIYGSRGANGVILITTKKGKSGKTTINYNGSFSLSKLCSVTNYMNSGELLDYKRNAAITGGTYNGSYGTAPDPDRDRASWLGTQSYMDAIVAQAYKIDDNGNPVLRAATSEEIANGYASEVPVYNSSKLPTTNWGDLATRTAFAQNHQISLSAGTDKSNIYFSLSYLNQQVPMKDQNYKRYSADIKGEITPLKWLKAGMGISATHSIKDYGIVSNFSNTVAKDSYGLAMNLMPWTPAYKTDESVLITDDGDAEHNILRDIDSAKNEYRYYGINFNSYFEVKLLPWLKWHTNLGAQFRNSRYGSFYGENWSNPYGYDSTEAETAYNSQSENLSWTLENLIYINKTFNKIHKFNVTLMQSAERYRTESLACRAYNVVYPTSLWYNLASSNSDKYAPTSGYSTWSRASYMGRINYSLMDKYLLTLTGRFDGASVLAEGNKWDFFPSAAIAWRMEQEEFIKKVKWIDQLKVRVGYGVTGNSSVGAYSTAGSCTSTYANIPFGTGNVSKNTTGTKTDVMPNTSLGWEKTASTNFGIDFSVLNHRINGSIDYYIANTYDLLMDKSLPVITGYGLVQSNIGKTQNNGLEISLSTVNVKTKDFTWQTDWTFSMDKEKVKALANGASKDTSGPWFVGSPINIYWDYKYDRIWQNTNEDKEKMAVYKAASNLTFLPGQYKIKDQDFIKLEEGAANSITKTVTIDGEEKTITYKDNGFGTFDSDDKVIYKKTPNWVGGLNNSFSYKNWNFSFFTYFRFGNYYYGLAQTIGRRKESNLWSSTNTGAKFAQPTTAKRTSTYDGARNYSKGNMILIRNIGLSYTVPKSFLAKISASSAQIYAQVLNPFLFGGELVKAGINPDDITGWTDARHIGGQTNNTCITRSLVLGIRLGF
ncbi:MAG: TonB-dependent receptor [Bacteroidaceae bacterium]|nr:TonB-dependent receptor [Bacteroidaceae bacterium]